MNMQYRQITNEAVANGPKVTYTALKNEEERCTTQICIIARSKIESEKSILQTVIIRTPFNRHAKKKLRNVHNEIG